MSFTYPVTLNLENRRCIVIGGGQVAARKVKTLLEQKAHVVVVSPDLSEGLLAEKETFCWQKDFYKKAYLDKAFLVIAATNNHDVNEKVADDCAELGILVNVIDNKAKSDFIVNAAFTQGDLLIAVSTDGISPAVAKEIKEQLKTSFGVEYAVMLEILKNARQEALEKIHDESKRRQFLQSLAKMDLISQLKSESAEDVEKKVKICLSSYWD